MNSTVSETKFTMERKNIVGGSANRSLLRRHGGSRHMNFNVLTIIFALACLITGCSTPSKHRNLSTEQAKIMDVAKAFAKSQLGYSIDEVKPPFLTREGYYSVDVWYNRNVPGGFVTLDISTNRSVLRWHPGQ